MTMMSRADMRPVIIHRATGLFIGKFEDVKIGDLIEVAELSGAMVSPPGVALCAVSELYRDEQGIPRVKVAKTTVPLT